MTLIAAAGVDTYPAIFGSLLISGPERPGPVPDVPLVGEGTNVPPAGSESSIPGLNQKLVLLADNCVIAWAGTVVLARTIIGELHAIASKSPLSLPIIDTYLSQLDPKVNDEVSFVGWVKDGDTFHQFWYRADTAEGAMFGRISAGGSGATDFVKHASQISGGTWNVPSQALTGLERPISSMLSATSLLLRAELSSESSLRHFCGGSYEIATVIHGKFAKLGDIAFVFWMADVTDGQVAVSGPQFIVKQDYAGEFLLLRVLRMHPSVVTTDPPVLEEAKHVIAPLGSTVDAAQATGITWPGMEATFTCHVVFVRSPKDFAVVNRIEHSPSRTPTSISFTSNGSHLSFGVSQQFREELAQSIRTDLA